MRLLAALALLLGLGCGADTPAPEYPFPASPPLEETDLARYVDDGESDPEVEDEEWDDGLSDEDLEMDGDGAPEPAEGGSEGASEEPGQAGANDASAPE